MRSMLTRSGPTDRWEIIQMLGGIAKIPAGKPEQIEHILQIALDGLRQR